MESLAEELAKGNLSKPVKEEKSKLFGKFLWSMDMLREKLEQEKEKEMTYVKERKTLMLSLSHDIKTPLAAIDLYTKALSSGLYDTDEKKEEAYNGIEKNLKELSNYIEEITAASRDDFLMLEVKDDEVYLGNVLTRIEEYYHEKFSRLHTEFTINKYDDMLIRGDEDRLVEVMQNVLENAIKYGDGKKISISFSEEEDCKLIAVENTGCSLEESELSSIFDSFYRGSNTTNIRGNGLGLYIVKQLMTKMDGDVFASIVDGRFRVTLVVRKL
jgi:signal transduction histidine kinase